MLASLLQLISIKDWLKNTIIFLPMIFSGNLSDSHLYFNLLIVFLFFCFTTSMMYILNDMIDIEEDKKHSIKKDKKPLASNKLSLNSAYMTLVFLLLMILISLFFSALVLFHMICYVIINLLYSFLFKKIPFLDLCILSFGYLISLDAGSTAIDVETSGLLFLAMFSLSFFMTTIKSLVEFKYQKNKSKSLKFYSSSMLVSLIMFSGVIFLMCSVSFFLIKNFLLLMLFPFLLFIMYSYYNIAMMKSAGEFPIELVFKDKMLLLICSSSMLIIIYFFY